MAVTIDWDFGREKKKNKHNQFQYAYSFVWTAETRMNCKCVHNYVDIDMHSN